MRVTSDVTPTIGTGIATNTDAATAALSVAALGGTTTRREHCRVGLQVSYTGVRAMLNPGIPRPLIENIGESHPKKTRPAKDRRATKGNIPGGERHDSEGRLRQQRTHGTRTAPKLRPTPPHFRRG